MQEWKIFVRRIISYSECGKGFQDMRGLTSHARHQHGICKEKLSDIVYPDGKSHIWKIISGFGAALITIPAIGGKD